MNPSAKNSTAPATPPPAFDEKTAKAIAPTRHDGTGRTFCHVQGDHLFSATRVFVATDKAAAAAALETLAAVEAAEKKAKATS